MANTTIYDFIDSNSRKTVWLMILFPVSLTAIVYIVILLASIIGTSNGQPYSYTSALTAANQAAAEVLPIVSATAILWILISYFAG
ncbi:MAG: hypothetical protein LBT07_00715 [Endomicrobium sp.]|jgi:heat shock protein HtpX|nr:hypothetical protein [Endomicrobium sp.]